MCPRPRPGADFFITKVRNTLHAILCFSPVGQQFRIWCMQFPALANSTIIDWFHPWPHQALVSVAQRFLADVDLTSMGGGGKWSKNFFF